MKHAAYLNGALAARHFPTGRSDGLDSTRIETMTALVAALGHDRFLDTFVHECERLSGARQVTAFSIANNAVRCFIAHRPAEQQLVEGLCRNYAASYFAKDPVLAGCGNVDLFKVETLASEDIPDTTYRARMFVDVDLSDKIAVIARQGSRAIYLNFYFNTPAQARLAEPTIRLFAPFLTECLQKHDVLTGGLFRNGVPRERAEQFLRQRFPALSDREVQICALIVCGFSVEGIALEIGVSPATIITFRKRAYAKMSIASRGELFAHCMGLAM